MGLFSLPSNCEVLFYWEISFIWEEALSSFLGFIFSWIYSDSSLSSVHPLPYSIQWWSRIPILLVPLIHRCSLFAENVLAYFHRLANSISLVPLPSFLMQSCNPGNSSDDWVPSLSLLKISSRTLQGKFCHSTTPHADPSIMKFFNLGH